MKLLYISTGGTIDKGYPRDICGYAFEFQQPPAAFKIWQTARVDISEVKHVVVCEKDSQEITDDDRQKIVEVIIENSEFHRILITHGTDTIIDTANYIAERVQERIVVLTGSFLPQAFRDSDAEFNLGMALGALRTLKDYGSYVAIQGMVERSDRIVRNLETTKFEAIK